MSCAPRNTRRLGSCSSLSRACVLNSTHLLARLQVFSIGRGIGTIAHVLLVISSVSAFAAPDTCKKDGGTAICRDPVVGDYRYSMSPPVYATSPLPPFWHGSAEAAIAQRQSLYMPAGGGLCSATPGGVGGWGGDQAHWGQVPLNDYGIEKQNAAYVQFTFVGPSNNTPMCSWTQTAQEGVLRERTVSCLSGFGPNYDTSPTFSYC